MWQSQSDKTFPIKTKIEYKWKSEILLSRSHIICSIVQFHKYYNDFYENSAIIFMLSDNNNGNLWEICENPVIHRRYNHEVKKGDELFIKLFQVLPHKTKKAMRDNLF